MRILSGLLTATALVGLGVSVYAQSVEGGDEPLRVSALGRIDFDENFSDMRIVQVDGVESRGYGDRAAGCYAAAFRIALPANAGMEKIAGGVISALRINSFEVRTEDAAVADYGEVRTFSLRNENMNGIATLALSKSGPPQANLLACYWNDRNPSHCAAICTASLSVKGRGEKR